MNGNGYDNGVQQQYLEQQQQFPQQQQYPNQFQQYQQQQFNQFHGNNDFNQQQQQFTQEQQQQQQQYPNYAQQYHNNPATTTSETEFGGSFPQNNFQGYNNQSSQQQQHVDQDSQLRQQLMTPPGSNLNQISPLRQHLMSQTSNSHQPLNMLEHQVDQVPADKLNNGAGGVGHPGQYNFQMNGGHHPPHQPKKPIVVQSTSGFDPFSTTGKDLYHEKKDEISYEWVC